MELMVVRGRSYFCQSPKSGGGGGQEFFFTKTQGMANTFFFFLKKPKFPGPPLSLP